MEKEPRKHSVMESLLPTKILRNSNNSGSGQSRNVRPKSCEYSELCNQLYSAAFGKLVPTNRPPEDVDNDWDELIGHPVCISGVKQGILRYYGRTKFADGLWCGIELDEAVGKNDGMVNGIRYFYCKQNRGIFAPVTKVSLLPLSSSKRHSAAAGDQNFYRKQEIQPRDIATSSAIQCATSSGDTVFSGKQNCNRFCVEYLDESHCLADARSTVEQHNHQQQLIDVNECRGCRESKFSTSKSVDKSNTLPINTNNAKVSMIADTTMHMNAASKQHKLVQHSQISRLTAGLDRKQALDYMSFPRKVMSEYSLGERENTTSLTPSRSYPYTASAGKGLQSFEVESYFRNMKDAERVSLKKQGLILENRVQKESSKSYNHQSLEFLDTQDDRDEDQLSLDYDESLGILTPSEMKDFTLCADLPTSYSDTRALDFPSSESFDDVNDLPEDEQVQEPSMMIMAAAKQQYVSSSSSTISPDMQCIQQQQHPVMQHELQQQQVSASQSHVVTSTDRFFSSISSGKVREVLLTCDYGSYPQQDYISPEEMSPHAVATSDYSNFHKQKQTVSSPFNETEEECGHMPSAYATKPEYFSEVDTLQMPCLQSLLENAKVESVDAACKEMEDQHQHRSSENAVKTFSDTESSRDSLLPEQDHTIVKEKLTVSWEDCIAECTEDMIFNKVERPESVYTVGSNDTGYQEDGEFETGMTTSMESSEDYKRFSMASRDSCIPTDDLEIDKVAESTSTSGYSTGLSDSCCNDRRDGRNLMMDDSFQDVPDPCNSDDAQDVAYDALNSSEISEKVDGFFDMDSCKDTESASEFHITESSTVLGLDSTSDTLCETVVVNKDDTLVNANGDNAVVDNPVAADQQVCSKTKDVPSPVGANKSVSSTTVAQKTPSSPAKKSPERRQAKVEKLNLTTSNNKKSNNSVNSPKDKPETKKADLKSPKRNVMSKLKAVIGGSSGSSKTSSAKTSKTAENNEQQQSVKKPSVPKKSRWEAVTSKIAASLAEEKTKPKAKKDVRSRVDTNLSSARLCRSPKLDSSIASDNRADISIGSSTSSKSGKTDRYRNLARGRDANKSMQVAEPGSRSPRHIQSLLSLMAGCAPVCRMTYVAHTPPGPCKTCSSSRSTSPVAASESSTSVSYTSHQSRSKIAIWKGSNSTVASSVPPSQKTKVPENTSLRSATTSRFQQTRDLSKGGIAGKLRSACAKATSNNSTCPLSPRSSTAQPLKSARLKGSKEQGNAQRPLIAPRPVRPPMWLSKAELTQEIQHLTNLCESRTKELNRLKMEARKVSTGFDALAVVIHYMSSDLKAFDNPGLAAEVHELQRKLIEAKEELAHYKSEVEELNSNHVKEMELLSDKLKKEHQEKVGKMSAKHEAKMSKLKEKQEQEIKSMTDALRASCEEEKLQNAKMVDDLKKELLKQREEMEIFHQHELDDLEERHLEKQKSLTAEIEKLQKRCEDAQQLSQNMEEALQKDTDSKMQWLSSKRQDLQNEVDSLKAVLEIKNNELHSLRKENLGMQKELEELHVAREKIKMLQARAEDLQALMNEKVRIERQLSNEHQVMKETYEREAKANKRLSMENEELLWRLKQVSETSLMTVPIADESEMNETDINAEVSSSFTTPDFEEEIATPSSPAKSPRPPSASRPMFFTYMNEEELSSRSPGSPRTQYKRIQPSCSKSQSPARQFKSPSSRPSPRRSRGSSDLSPQSRGETPRKLVKRSNSLRDAQNQNQISEGSEEKVQNGNVTSTQLVVAESVVSSASSENSVFEPCLLEEHSDQMCISLKMLEEQRTADFILDVSSLSCNSQGEWQIISEAVDSQAECCAADQEYIDPKTYYHMTFPVKDSVQDLDVDDVRKEANNTKSESL